MLSSPDDALQIRKLHLRIGSSGLPTARPHQVGPILSSNVKLCVYFPSVYLRLGGRGCDSYWAIWLRARAPFGGLRGRGCGALSAFRLERLILDFKLRLGLNLFLPAGQVSSCPLCRLELGEA